jgi:hypothetical protein
MDSASSARIRAIVDRLLVSTLIGSRDGADLEEVRAFLAAKADSLSITMRHDPRTTPEPSTVPFGCRRGGAISTIDDLRLLERDIIWQGGNPALRDANLAAIRRMIEAQASSVATTVWWKAFGPDSGFEWRPAIGATNAIPPSPKPRALVDFIVTAGPSPVKLVATHLGVDEAYARHLVSRADTELFDCGGKAEISISGGMVHTAVSTQVVSFQGKEQQGGSQRDA